MKRVRFQAMEQREGRYWYRGTPFTGIGFSVSDRKVSAFEVEDGIVTRPYRPICAPDNSEFLQIELGGELSDYETPVYLGKPFSGIGYEFAGDDCNFEAFLDKGDPLSQAHWDRNGTMVYFAAPPNDVFRETCEWYQNGAIKSIAISTSTHFSGAVRFSEEGWLVVLTSRGGFLGQVSEIYTKARFFPISNVSEFATIRWAEEVTLAGDDIDDDFVGLIICCGALSGTSKLTLSDTNVKSFNVYSVTSLKEVNIIDSNNMKYLSNPHDTETINLARSIKKARPDLRVVLNRRELGD